MKKINRIFVVFCLIIIFPLTSCHSSESVIVGTWVPMSDNRDWRLTFFRDGTINVSGGSENFEGTYYIEGCTVTFTTEWETQLAEFEINGNKLVLIPANGENPLTLIKE